MFDHHQLAAFQVEMQLITELSTISEPISSRSLEIIVVSRPSKAGTLWPDHPTILESVGHTNAAFDPALVVNRSSGFFKPQ